MISNNPDILLVSIWISLDLFRHIIHKQELFLLWYILLPTWTLDTYLFQASKFGEVVDSHQFRLLFFNTINTTWNWYSELINEFTTQPWRYGETINPIEPIKSQHNVVSVHHTLTKNANLESENPFRSQTIAILINDTITKSLDHVSCADCILNP